MLFAPYIPYSLLEMLHTGTLGRDYNCVRWLTTMEKHDWQQLLTMEFALDHFNYLFLSTLTNCCSPIVTVHVYLNDKVVSAFQLKETFFF